ncbi:hypothetical protein AHAS_Ahas09G0070500 [Arachis hypogaea]
MSIWKCCELLDKIVDEIEAIRKDYPNEDWLHLTGFIHDLGKVLLFSSFGELLQWAVVGDIFQIGCRFDESNVHHKYFKENPDYNNPVFNTKYGIILKNVYLTMEGAYKHLMNDEDVENLKWVHIFKLYSKSNVRIDVEKVKPYYLSLVEKYFPTAKLRW